MQDNTVLTPLAGRTAPSARTMINPVSLCFFLHQPSRDRDVQHHHRHQPYLFPNLSHGILAQGGFLDARAATCLTHGRGGLALLLVATLAVCHGSTRTRLPAGHIGLPFYSLCFGVGLSTTQSCPSLVTSSAPFIGPPAALVVSFGLDAQDTSSLSAAACCL